MLLWVTSNLLAGAAKARQLWLLLKRQAKPEMQRHLQKAALTRNLPLGINRSSIVSGGAEPRRVSH